MFKEEEIPDEGGDLGIPKVALYKGPDALRPNPGVRPGVAFIYIGPSKYNPDVPSQGEIFYDSFGHERILNLNERGWHILTALYSPEELKKLGEDSKLLGTGVEAAPFTDWQILRARAQERALFGRYGTSGGKEVIMFWPGTNNFTNLLKGCIILLEKDNRITDDAVITVGRSAKYTVKYFKINSSVVGSELEKNNKNVFGKNISHIMTASELKAAREKEKWQKGRWPYELYPEMSFITYVECRDEHNS